MRPSSFLIPKWPIPANVRAYTTTRIGGVSKGAYESFNLGPYVQDDETHVTTNRQYLKKILQLPAEPVWLKQIHSTQVIHLNETFNNQLIEADGSWTQQSGKVCVVTTADCLPVLLCDQKGTCVSALHAGWRGLMNGILEEGVKALSVPPREVLAWLGPAISAEVYEVGEEVRQAFLQEDKKSEQAFRPSERAEHWYMDIYLLARQRLQAAGVSAIFGGEHCTYREADKFYSYRRDKVTGRMASLIWLR